MPPVFEGHFINLTVHITFNLVHPLVAVLLEKRCARATCESLFHCFSGCLDLVDVLDVLLHVLLADVAFPLLIHLFISNHHIFIFFQNFSPDE